jgi:hypothetical protein
MNLGTLNRLAPVTSALKGVKDPDRVSIEWVRAREVKITLRIPGKLNRSEDFEQYTEYVWPINNNYTNYYSYAGQKSGQVQTLEAICAEITVEINKRIDEFMSESGLSFLI